jgi:hypothetical protein
MFEKDYYQCTCGYDTTNEANAIRHASMWHATEAERQDLERLKSRIRIMISSLNSPFSFDLHLYGR